MPACLQPNRTSDKPKDKPDFADISLPDHVKVCKYRCQQLGPEIQLSGLISEGLQTRSTELPKQREELEGQGRRWPQQWIIAASVQDSAITRTVFKSLCRG